MHDEVENYIILRRSWHKLDYHESLFKTKWTLIFLEKIKKSCSHLVVRAMDHERKKRPVLLIFFSSYSTFFFKKNINNHQNGLNSKCYYFVCFFRLGNADCIFSILKVKVMSTMLRLLLIELQKCLDMCTMFFETKKSNLFLST